MKNEIKLNYDDWKMTDNRYVGYIDIMGFKDMVARNPHEKINKMMNGLTESIQITQEYFSGTESFHNGKPPSEVKAFVRVVTYSDSIMIYSKNASLISQEKFINCVSNLVDFMFLDEIPFRGAVAFGKMTLNFPKSIFFGQPLIDAYLLSEELAFYAVVVHSSAEYKKNFTNPKNCVFSYPCQFKTGVANHSTIAPIGFLAEYYEERDLKELQKSITKLGIKTSGSIRKYIDNTLKYMDYLATTIKENNNKK